MTTPFAIACTVFGNATRFKITTTRIPSFPPVDSLAREALRTLGRLEEVGEDPAVGAVRVRLAKLRATVLYSLLPFDSPDLQLASQVRAIDSAATYLPDVADQVQVLVSMVDCLLEEPANPKREIVLRLLAEAGSQQTEYPAGLVFLYPPGLTPGWGTTLANDLRQHAPTVEPVLSQKSLLARTYSTLVLPWSGRRCPLLNDLFHSFRSPVLHVVAYSSERLHLPERTPYPQVPALKRSPWPHTHDLVPEEVAGAELRGAESYWQVLQPYSVAHPGHEALLDDRAFLVRARLVLLADGTQVFLREDSKVLELSDLLDGRGDLVAASRRFPRVPVIALRPGDLVVLRTTGSGDYLIDVADSLMAKAGVRDLRAKALDWKPALKAALEEHGSEKIGELLAARGHKLASGHRYIWVWTTNEVIHPESDSLFYELLAILQDLGFLRAEALETAEKRLQQMHEIIRFHHLAGNEIRRALLSRLRGLIARNTVVADRLTLSLPGVDAGALSVLRVAAVEPTVRLVPYGQIGDVTSAES